MTPAMHIIAVRVDYCFMDDNDTNPASQFLAVVPEPTSHCLTAPRASALQGVYPA